ncbi:MAG: hypothetical protein IPP06_15820 [Saprospiraceae bacterium]|nr:hypothetical protein [Candidatus Vicinibacter affinis]
MQEKATILMTFAKNDLAGVKTEAENIYNSVHANDLVKVVKIEDADIDTLAEAIIDNNEDLLMFHYGGHADQHSIVLDGFRSLDNIRLSNLLLPKENHNLSIVFLNGCLSYGHVGTLTARGVKVIIATNVKVDDEEAVRLSKFFYKCFFEKNYTFKSAFETAEATVRGKNSYPIVVNPGAIDETQSMPSSWTLFVHSKYTEVLEWTLEDFINGFQKKIKLSIDSLEQYINISESKLDMDISQLQLKRPDSDSKKMKEDNIKNIVSKLIAEGKTEDAIKTLLGSDLTLELRKEATQVAASYATLKSKVIKGILTHEQETTELN